MYTNFCHALKEFIHNLLITNNMKKSVKIFSDKGAVIESAEEILKIDPDLRITASNGVDIYAL